MFCGRFCFFIKCIYALVGGSNTENEVNEETEQGFRFVISAFFPLAFLYKLLRFVIACYTLSCGVSGKEKSGITPQGNRGLLRSFGTRYFNKQELAQATGISMANIGYNLKSLRRFSVIDMKKDGSTSYIYCLAAPIEEAVRELRVRGFSPVALVG